ncbi:MbtH family NRPS accessory protein [Streptomyces sp. CRN 30]|uniref:MbtH family NRPS accessory protein n=1 Tax=Streptomyces sp. CRN 30 TaxID=3075613 RepID=UPI002A801424|nr:MbtH family NRPS accessory protein [Streptomyces sp. CRN 30]
MSADTASPFDAGPDDGRASHLVLVNAGGLRSLWPAWRAVPAGWTALSGPAPHATCLTRLTTDRP